MKMPLAWHRECLKNMRASLEAIKAREQYERNQRERLEADIEWLDRQIRTAVAEKRDGFDRDRFLKRKR